jgi:histidinol phosphatase-like PHP family hydrolase
MVDSSLDILVISDLHTIREVDHACSLEERKCFLGPVLLRKALLRLRREGIDVGLVIVLGDVVDDGDVSGAEEDLVAVAEEARSSKLPVLAVPGNHDGDFGRFAEIFGCGPGLHEIGGYGFLLFHDHVGEGDVTTRPPEGLRFPGEVAAARPELPLIALQHNPLHPYIESDYPYTLANADAVLSSYRDAGVILSFSGHYHAGQPAHRVGDVTCYTVPAACKEPFRFAHVRLRGREVEVREHALKMDTPGLVDMHCHTEYAYCAEDVAAARNVEISRAMGLHGLCLVEHTFQLYFDPDDAWSYRWQTDDDMVRRAWENGRGRMSAYREFVQSLRDGYVRLGLEVDLRADGSLLLAEEDRPGWDLLVGAIHRIPGFEEGRTTQAEAEKLFLRDTERMLAHPIQILAHPFRFFVHNKLERPTHLHVTVAEWLARSGVAAEVNFHDGNNPDPCFIEECLSRGVKIALSTDSHNLAEVGELSPHVKVLKQAGVHDEDLPNVLYRLG